jgi:hypothetical protein
LINGAGLDNWEGHGLASHVDGQPELSAFVALVCFALT